MRYVLSWALVWCLAWAGVGSAWASTQSSQEVPGQFHWKRGLVKEVLDKREQAKKLGLYLREKVWDCWLERGDCKEDREDWRPKYGLWR